MSLTGNAAILDDIYADLPAISLYAADTVVLHPSDGSAPIRGKDAVIQHVTALIRATDGTLEMDVEHIAATEHFGAVLGTLRAHVAGVDIAHPFCGLWKFAPLGVIIEHWENDYDTAALKHALTSPDQP